jgi:hypothetical protein
MIWMKGWSALGLGLLLLALARGLSSSLPICPRLFLCPKRGKSSPGRARVWRKSRERASWGPKKELVRISRVLLRGEHRAM